MSTTTYHNKNIVGLIQFVIILDNEGKRLYSRYYFPEDHELYKVHNQKEFEKKIGVSVNNFNVNKSNERKYYNK